MRADEDLQQDAFTADVDRRNSRRGALEFFFGGTDDDIRRYLGMLTSQNGLLAYTDQLFSMSDESPLAAFRQKMIEKAESEGWLQGDQVDLDSVVEAAIEKGYQPPPSGYQPERPKREPLSISKIRAMRAGRAPNVETKFTLPEEVIWKEREAYWDEVASREIEWQTITEAEARKIVRKQWGHISRKRTLHMKKLDAMLPEGYRDLVYSKGAGELWREHDFNVVGGYWLDIWEQEIVWPARIEPYNSALFNEAMDESERLEEKRLSSLDALMAEDFAEADARYGITAERRAKQRLDAKNEIAEYLAIDHSESDVVKKKKKKKKSPPVSPDSEPTPAEPNPTPELVPPEPASPAPSSKGKRKRGGKSGMIIKETEYVALAAPLFIPRLDERTRTYRTELVTDLGKVCSDMGPAGISPEILYEYLSLGEDGFNELEQMVETTDMVGDYRRMLFLLHVSPQVMTRSLDVTRGDLTLDALYRENGELLAELSFHYKGDLKRIAEKAQLPHLMIRDMVAAHGADPSLLTELRRMRGSKTPRLRFSHFISRLYPERPFELAAGSGRYSQEERTITDKRLDLFLKGYFSARGDSIIAAAKTADMTRGMAGILLFKKAKVPYASISALRKELR